MGFPHSRILSLLTFQKNIPPIAASDDELVRAYKQTGDAEILARLYQRYMDLVFAVCMKYFRNREDAQDGVMNIFEELLVKLKKYEVVSFKSWLYAVARTHCLMRLRRESGKRNVELDPALVQSTEEWHLNGVFEQEARLDLLNGCLEKLAAEQKTVVEMFYLRQKSYKEIAQVTGSDWNKVRSQIQNGRRNLKICMENQEKTKND